MAKPCKKIKYKQRRKSKPVVKIQKPFTPPSVPQSPPSYNSSYFDGFLIAEGDYEKPEKDVENQKSPLACLREWLEKQRFIPKTLSDDFLMLFLSWASYDFRLAAEKLQKYFSSRQEPSPLFRDLDPLSPENVKISKKLYVLPMPDTTEEGRKIILTGLVQPTVYYTQMEHIKALTKVIDLLIWEKDFGFGDFVIVLDGRGFECPQLLENRVYNHRSIKSLLLDTIPGTLRSFYLFYPPPYVANVANNRNGIWFTLVTSKQEMIRHLPADILPLEYGGNLGHLEDLLEQWELHMVQNRDFFINLEKRMINDYRRRLFYEAEMKNRGKNWVQKMKLEEDEWEYKMKYYEKMKNMTPFKHPAFGSQRMLLKPKPKPRVKRKTKCWKMAQKEAEDEEAWQPSKPTTKKSEKIQQGNITVLPTFKIHIFCS